VNTDLRQIEHVPKEPFALSAGWFGDNAALGRPQTAQTAKDGRLARSIWTRDEQVGPFLNFKAEIIDEGDAGWGADFNVLKRNLRPVENRRSAAVVGVFPNIL
jgi:hypothetical protein